MLKKFVLIFSNRIWFLLSGYRFCLLMPQFVRDCMRQRDSIVLVDTAAAIWLTHASDVRHSQCTARSIRARTNVLSRHQNRHVVVIWM